MTKPRSTDVSDPADSAAAPTPDEVRQLPSSERRVYVERIRIFYPRWHEALSILRSWHEVRRASGEPAGHMIVGQAGVGITTILEAYSAGYPRVMTATGTRSPVVYAVVPGAATLKSTASALLEALGDPFAIEGSEEVAAYRAINLFRDCKVELLLLDQAHHLRKRGAGKIAARVIPWFATFLAETKTACALAGLEGETERVADNPHLATWFDARAHVLTPFRWDPNQPAETIGEFRMLLRELEALVPLRERSNLAQADTAWRLYVASRGVMGRLMMLIRWATHLALEQGRERLDHNLLAEAYKQRLAGGRSNGPNPFVGAPPVPCPTTR